MRLPIRRRIAREESQGLRPESAPRRKTCKTTPCTQRERDSADCQCPQSQGHWPTAGKFRPIRQTPPSPVRRYSALSVTRQIITTKNKTKTRGVNFPPHRRSVAHPTFLPYRRRPQRTASSREISGYPKRRTTSAERLHHFAFAGMTNRDGGTGRKGDRPQPTHKPTEYFTTSVSAAEMPHP